MRPLSDGGKDTDILRLSRLNAMLSDITSTMVISRDFREIADRLLVILKRAMPAEALEFYVQLEDDTVLHLAPRAATGGCRISSASDFQDVRESAGGLAGEDGELF